MDDVHGADFTGKNPSGDPIEYGADSHGTHCAGILAAKTNNSVGIASVAGVAQGKVKLMAIKVFGKGDDRYAAVSKTCEGLEYAIAMGVRLSSNSWGSSSPAYLWLTNLLKNNPNHLFITSAGNEGQQIKPQKISKKAFFQPKF